MNTSKIRQPSREEVIDYLKRQGHPEPDKDWVDDFVFHIDKNRREQFWEAVVNDYDLPDFDRWQHFENVINTECSWKCFLTCSNAMWEEEIEILELGSSQYWDKQNKNEISVFYGENKRFYVEVFSSEKPDFDWVAHSIYEHFIEKSDKDFLSLIDSIYEIYLSINTHNGEYIDSDSMEIEDVEKLKTAVKEKFVAREVSQDKNFIFDEELMGCQDEHCECVDGYLCATDYLVEKMKSVIDHDRTPDEMETLDNINFYAYYNVKDSSLEVNGTYWYFESTYFKETQGEFILPLTKEEKVEIIEEMEKYCQSWYKCSCLEFVNDGRQEVGKPKIVKEPVRSSLTDQIQNAEQRKTVSSIEDKNTSVDKAR